MPDDTVECVYCGCPEVDDAAAWAAEARHHAPDCEWILTRAHRLMESISYA